MELVTGLLGFFVAAAKELREAVAGLRKAPRDERERIATYFDEIAACLREIAKRVEAGDAPGDTCARLAVYAEELEDIIGSHDSLRASRDESVEQTRKRLGAALNRAQSDWAMLAETSDEKLWLYASGQWKQDEPSRAGELVWEDIAAARIAYEAAQTVRRSRYGTLRASSRRSPRPSAPADAPNRGRAAARPG